LSGNYQPGTHSLLAIKMAILVGALISAYFLVVGSLPSPSAWGSSTFLCKASWIAMVAQVRKWLSVHSLIENKY
jgi:hypothetical protein